MVNSKGIPKGLAIIFILSLWIMAIGVVVPSIFVKRVLFLGAICVVAVPVGYVVLKIIAWNVASTWFAAKDYHYKNKSQRRVTK